MITRIATTVSTIDVEDAIVDVEADMDQAVPIYMDLVSTGGEVVRIYKRHVIGITEVDQ